MLTKAAPIREMAEALDSDQEVYVDTADHSGCGVRAMWINYDGTLSIEVERQFSYGVDWDIVDVDSITAVDLL